MNTPDLPFRFKSIQQLFLVAITLLIAVLSLPLLFSGVKIINNITSQFGREILQEELQSLLGPINLRYHTLARVGLEDSRSHLLEIKENALHSLGSYRYKNTGSIFVISKERGILLSTDFTDPSSADFSLFLRILTQAPGIIEYTVGAKERIGVVEYYQPWDSYIGLTMDRQELFAPRNLFIKINLLVLLGVLAIAALFSLAIHHFLITPILRLTRFADLVSRGNYSAEIPGRFILELATMKQDILRMVATLISREKKYWAVFNAPGDAIFIHEAASSKILESNQAVSEMFGYTPTETLHLNIGDLSSGVHPYTFEEAAKRVAQVHQSSPQRFEWHARRKNGELFWVDIALRSFRYGQTNCVLAVIRDIEAQKKATQDLAAEKEQLAITLRSIGDGVITTDDQGSVILVNRVAENLTGWSQIEAEGRPLSEILSIINSKSGEPCPDPAMEVLKSGRQVEMKNHTVLLARDGTRRDIADSAAPIYNPSSEMVGVVLVFRDVTEKQRIEKELHKIKKLESVGILAGGIAHDFNNLLTAILGNINLARTTIQDDTHRDKLLSEAEKASLRAQHLTHQLLIFSKGGEPIRQSANLSEIIRDNADFVLRGSTIGFTFKPPDDLWNVDIDPGQIGQVIQNIILNARQALAEHGGLIEIKTSNCQECIESEMSCDSCVHVTISDNGPGIPPETLEKIFDPYFSTKEKGSGLGLAICHSIIKKHKGVMLVQSELGKGTVFTLKLPVSTEMITPFEETLAANGRHTGLKILIMDDEEMLRTLAFEMFSVLGHEPQTVPGGAEALVAYQQAMEEGSPFDLVIMDLTIPGGMGGKKTIEKILALDPAAKVIVSSGYSNDPVMANYKDYGFVAMLVKPYRTQDLEQILNEIL
jgi:PAS domain S-box-containing protein